jgi:cytochrome c553
MKKMQLVLLAAASTAMFTYCSSTKKATASTAPKKTNYQDNVMALVATHCAPCHFPDKGGNKKALDNYTAVSTNIDEILRRTQLNPGERGFMPQRKPKLSDSTIAVLKQWKADGLGEK